ncbi:MAG TPA: hypothetical protein VHO25_09595 [Polyangiaceae bacterium]|nr:hypothetical protein [Polyangiaceae bacterium]
MTYSEIRSNFLEAGRRRSYLALLRNELERIEEFGRMLNINAWSHPEVIFPTGAGQFSPLQLETLLPEVFGDLVSDPNLVSALNTVRELIHGIDSAARAVASKAAEKRLTEKDVHTHIRFLRNDPARVSGEARRALDALKKVVW